MRGEARVRAKAKGNAAKYDPDTVSDTATFESPHIYAVGIPRAAVNGTLVVEKCEYTGATPGKGIRDIGD